VAPFSFSGNAATESRLRCHTGDVRPKLALVVVVLALLLVIDVWCGVRKGARFVGAIGALQSQR